MPKRKMNAIRSSAQKAAQRKAAIASAAKRRKANSDKKFDRAAEFFKTFKNDPDPKIQQQVKYAKNMASIILKSSGSNPVKPMSKKQYKKK